MKTSPEKTIWKLTVAYDGTDYHGWQIQPGSTTIQGILADAIASVTGERVLPQGSGRTDAGVHALGQVASFDLCAAIPPGNLQRALNRILPAAIRVRAAEHAPAGFHARHSCVGKIYQYRLFLGAVCPPFLARYVKYCDQPLDFSALQEAAEMIVGEHDFTSFAASDPDRTARLADTPQSQRHIIEHIPADDYMMKDSTPRNRQGNVRRIEESHWSRSLFSTSSHVPMDLPSWPGEEDESRNSAPGKQQDPAREGDAQLWTYTVRGNGFLHHMVRNLVGTYLDIGRGRMTPGALVDILDARNRALAGPTAAAHGLCLVKVLYETQV